MEGPFCNSWDIQGWDCGYQDESLTWKHGRFYSLKPVKLDARWSEVRSPVHSPDNVPEPTVPWSSQIAVNGFWNCGRLLQTSPPETAAPICTLHTLTKFSNCWIFALFRLAQIAISNVRYRLRCTVIDIERDLMSRWFKMNDLKHWFSLQKVTPQLWASPCSEMVPFGQDNRWNWQISGNLSRYNWCSPKDQELLIIHDVPNDISINSHDSPSKTGSKKCLVLGLAL